MKQALFLLLFLSPSLLFAQPSNERRNQQAQELKKLQGQLNRENLSVNDLNTVREIRKIYNYLNLDSALYYANIEIDLSEKMEDPTLLANAKIAKGFMLWKLQRPEPARKLFLENIANRSLIADSSLAQSLFRISKVEIQMQMPSESLEHVIEAAEIFSSMKDSSFASACFSHIAGIYTFVLNEHGKAIPYFEKALDANGVKDQQNIIRIYINYSSALVGLSKFDEALTKIRMAEKLAKSPENAAFLPSIYAQFAFICYDGKKHQQAIDYALMGIELIKNNPSFDRPTRDKIYWYLALNYKELKNYQESMVYFDLVKNSRYLDPWDIQTNLIEIYKETGNYKEAFLMQEKLIAAKDSIDEIERFEKIKEVTERYENEKKQKEIVTLNAEKELQKSEIRTQRLILYGTIGFFVVLIVIGVFWFRTRTKLRETMLNLETTKLQQRFLRTQLNPHFFFHALTSIETYIYKNDQMESARFLRSFSLLMRNILEFSDVDFITLKQDMEFIEKYMELQQLNHEFKFDYKIEVSPELAAEEINIPPMLIQPAVENAILHGALSRENGEVTIQYSKINDQLSIAISDNGEANNRGQSSANKLNRSMSLDITQARINNFQEVHGVTILYRPFNSNENSEGSSVSFQMPIKL